MTKSSLWIEGYRPAEIEQLILPERIRSSLKEYVSENEIPHLLFVSPPGIGKTTAAKALANEMDVEYKMINASLQNSIDTLRTEISSFASTISLTDSQKMVILDECLEENETVLIGTVDNYKEVPLKDLEWGKIYPVVSFNMETGEFENDEGVLISEKEDEDLYEVELEDGRILTVNANHPFIVEEDCEYKERSIEDGLDESSKVVVK